MMKVIAAALVLLVAGAGAQVTKVQVGPNACLTDLNIMRAAKMDTRLPIVQNDSQLETEAKALLTAAYNASLECTSFTDPTSTLPFGAFLTRLGGAAYPCREPMMQWTDDFLTAVTEYPGPFDASSEPWNNDTGKGFAKIYLDSLEKMGCAYSLGCTNNYIICKLSSTPTTGKEIFSKKFFKALQKRKESNIALLNLTESAIGTSGVGVTDINLQLAGFLALSSLLFSVW